MINPNRMGCSPDYLAAAVSQFWENGYVRLPGLFSHSEVDVLRAAIKNSDRMNEVFRATQAKYLVGKYPSFETIFVWNDTSGYDLFSKFTRCMPIMEILDQAFKDEAYVYHNKVALKYQNMPGFKHHQDYFYWSTMGCLMPNMATCMIAIDDANDQNGCLRLVRRSHLLGRLEHVLLDGFSDSQVEPERLAAILERFPEDKIEMNAGDAVLFHCNTIHASAANNSEKPRLALLGCYNTKNNTPYHRRCAHPPFIRQSKIVDEVTPEDLTNFPDFTLSYEER